MKKTIYNIKNSEVSSIPWHKTNFPIPKEQDIPKLENKLFEYSKINFTGKFESQEIYLKSIDNKIKINISYQESSQRLGSFPFRFQVETKYINEIIVEVKYNNISEDKLLNIKKAVNGVYDITESLMQDPNFDKYLNKIKTDNLSSQTRNK